MPRAANMHEIAPRLWVGSWEAADELVRDRRVFAEHWAIICVLENPRNVDRDQAICLPALVHGTDGVLTEWVATRTSLERISVEIDRRLAAGDRVLVHCGAGMERSPLAVAWWLRTRRGLSLDEAYRRLMRRRRAVCDRRAWMAQDALALG